MNRILFALIAIVVAASAAFAQDSNKTAQRQQWQKEMQQAKLEFLCKEVGITAEQKEKFNSSYTLMDREINKLRRESRKQCRDIEKDKQASQQDYEKAAEDLYSLKMKEGAVEMRYYGVFKEILTPQQLIKLKAAENDWMKQLMKHRHKK